MRHNTNGILMRDKTIKDLNQLPSLNGFSSEISLGTMISGRPGADFNQVSELNVGDCVQAYRRRGRTNTKKARTVGVISLYPSGNY